MNRLPFSELGLSDDVVKAVEELGYEETTPIQTITIPLLMAGRDVIGQSQTGTGKTAAFGIPAIERVDHRERYLQVLILCPTRELAVQAAEEMKKFAKHKRGLRILPIYGGQSIDRQIMGLRQGVHIVIGTPGRVMDHMRRGTLKVDQLTTVILDEADEMLNMGFREDIETILVDTPAERQTVLFSATMSPEILAITKRFLKDPEFVKAEHHQLVVPAIEQSYFEVPGAKKPEALSRLIDLYDPKLALVFCNTKKRVDDLVSALQLRGYQADGLHGDLKQSARDRVMDKFRSGRLQILVATDVAARGIDVEDIEIVFNFDIPQDEEYYVHRIGRTGRAGKSGLAFTFVSGRNDYYELRDIMRYANVKVPLAIMPTQDDVVGSKLLKLTEQIRGLLAVGGFERYTRTVEQIMGEEYTPIDVAAVLLSQLAGEDLAETAKEAAILVPEADANGMVRLVLNIGRESRITPRDIVGAITGETGISGRVIGAIDIYDNSTCVEVPAEQAREIISVMSNSQIRGQQVTIEATRSKNKDSGRIGGRRDESGSYGGGKRDESGSYGGGYSNEGRSYSAGGRNDSRSDRKPGHGSYADKSSGSGRSSSGGDRSRNSAFKYGRKDKK